MNSTPSDIRALLLRHCSCWGPRYDDEADRGSLPFEQNGPKEDIDDLSVVVRICPL